jgi:hypothetical protein|tara:strand:- start:753 stop:1421 length:669 start_codon:yes stop_codon:yes gene_type:complete
MNIKITVPSNLSEITLEQYQRYLKVIEDVEQNDKAQMFVDLKMMEIFCGVPYTTAMKFPMSEVSRINRIIGSVLNDKSELVRTFQMGDSTFGFIPKLDEMTFGEYIDLDNFFGDWNNMHKAMSVLYRPIDKTYKDTLYSIKEYDGDTFHNAMKQMPLDAVFSSIVFFYTLGSELSKIMLNSLQDLEETDTTLKQDLIKNGDGILAFSTSLKEMLNELSILQN